MKKTNVNEEELNSSEMDRDVEIKEEKKINVNTLIEKGKSGKLSQSDLDEALEEMNYDVDRIDELYETLEGHGIAIEDSISSEEICQ